MALPVLNSNIRLRIVLKADPGTTREGIAIDDIHIYDNKNGIYTGTTTVAPVTQTTANSAGWIDFLQNGQLIASVNSNNQNLGTIGVQAYINTGAVRTNQTQYYLDRNVSIKPANPSLTSNATVRIYFLDAESEKLIAATGCAGCSKPSSAYTLGVSKYTDTNRNNEDGNITNNSGGIWSFITSANTVKVPFDKGYYAEIQVKDFSEFWFNSGGLLQNGPLPVELLSFTLNKNHGSDGLNQVDVAWTTTSEINADHFEVERVSGTDAFKLNQFRKIGEVRAVGNSSAKQHYTFTDLNPDITAINYYRLKIIDKDESSDYSRIQSISFDSKADWKTFPNPSTGIVNVLFQADAGSIVQVKTYDLQGNLLLKSNVKASGMEQKHTINLSQTAYLQGFYIIEVTSDLQKKIFRIVKIE
jgi:hypothetical protein